jgi:hypothetical protein
MQQHQIRRKNGPLEDSSTEDQATMLILLNKI